MASKLTLAKAYVQIIPSAEGMQGEITKELGGESEKAGKLAGETIVKRIGAIIAAAGIGKMIIQGIKASINAGAELEQSIGGIETLFKDSADTMIQYANNAFKTAGMSASDYMNTATSFAASLLQGLGGDTAKAAEISNMAITDMSDNVNKMGSNMEDVQNAYQGFAKQNYTMLDNLKLGYGGTKEEMQRLLEDAEKLSGVHYDISNLSDVYSAIHVIQEELGITGTTAQEAATTLSGSAAMVKSAWTNVLATLSTGGDIQTAMSNLASSAATFLFDNLIPALGNIILQLPSALGSFFVAAGPILKEKGGQLLTAIKDGFFNKLPEMLDNAPAMIDQFSQRLSERLSTMEENGGEMLKKIGQGFLNNFPTIVTIIAKLIATILLAIAKILPQLLQFGAKMLAQLGLGLIKGIPQLLAKIPEIFRKMKEAFTSKDWKGVGKDIVLGIINGITAAAKGLIDSVKNLAKNALDALKERLKIHSPSLAADEEVGQMLPPGIANGVKKKAGILRNTMKDIAGETLDSFPVNIGSVTASVSRNTDQKSAETDYGSFGRAVADAIADAGIALKVDGRVAGRITRKAMA